MKRLLCAVLAACMVMSISPMLSVTVSAVEENLVFKGASIDGGVYQSDMGTPENVIDGNVEDINSRWWSKNGVEGQYIVIKLANVSKIDRIVAWLGSTSAANSTYNVFEYSLNGTDWSKETIKLTGMTSTATEGEGIYYGADGIVQPLADRVKYKRTCTFSQGPVTAQYIKIGNTGTVRMEIYEVEIFGQEIEVVEGLQSLSVNGYSLDPEFSENRADYSINIGPYDPIPGADAINAILSDAGESFEIIAATESTPFIVDVTLSGGGKVTYIINVLRQPVHNWYNLLSPNGLIPENVVFNSHPTRVGYLDASYTADWKPENTWGLVMSTDEKNNGLRPWISVDLGEAKKFSVFSIILRDHTPTRNNHLYYSTAEEHPEFYVPDTEPGTYKINTYNEETNPEGWIKITPSSTTAEITYGGRAAEHFVHTFDEVEARHFAWHYQDRRNMFVDQFGIYNLTEQPYAVFDGESIPGNAPVSGKFEILNTTPSTTISVKASFILAVYDEDNRLYDVVVTDKSTEGVKLTLEGRKNVLSELVSSKNVPVGYTAKLFLWDDIGIMMNPVILAEELPKLP